MLLCCGSFSDTVTLGSIKGTLQRLLWGNSLISQWIYMFCFRRNLTLVTSDIGQSFADVFFCVHLFPPCFLKSPCLILRPDSLQWLPALKWKSSTLVTLAWAFGFGYRTVLLTTTTIKPLPLTMDTLLSCLTCFSAFPFSNLLAPCYRHNPAITLELYQIVYVHCNRNSSVSLGRGRCLYQQFIPNSPLWRLCNQFT